MNMSDLEPVTQEEESELRDDIESWMIAKGQCHHAGGLHIPNGDEPLCSKIRNHTGSNRIKDDAQTEWREKDVAVFPPGYKDICQYCAALWR